MSRARIPLVIIIPMFFVLDTKRIMQLGFMCCQRWSPPANTAPSFAIGSGRKGAIYAVRDSSLG